MSLSPSRQPRQEVNQQQQVSQQITLRPNTGEKLTKFYKGLQKEIQEKMGMQQEQAQISEVQSFLSIESYAKQDLQDIKIFIKQLHNSQIFDSHEIQLIKQSFKEVNTDKIIQITQPKLIKCEHILKQIEIILKNEYNPNSDVLQSSIPVYQEIFGIIRLFLQLIHFIYIETNNKCVDLIEGHNKYLIGLEAIKELHDPNNEECGLWGLTKLSKAAYKQNQHIAYTFLSQNKYPQANEELEFLQVAKKQLLQFIQDTTRLRTKVQLLTEELNQTDKKMLDFKEKAEQENMELNNQIENIKLSVGAIMGGNKERETPMERMLKGQNQAYQETIRKLSEEIQNLSIQCKAQEAQIKEIKKKSEAKNKKATTTTAQVQCNLYRQIRESNQMLRQFQKTVNLQECLEDNTGNVQNLQWLNHAINVIYVEKLKGDYQDDAEFRVRTNLNQFVQEWSLCKLGCRKLAQIFLKDFSATIRNFAAQHDRVLLFAELLGIQVDVFDVQSFSTKNTKLVFNKKNSTTSIKMLVQTLYALRKTKSPILPFLWEEQIIVPTAHCKAIFTGVLQDENIPSEKSNYEESVKRVEKQDWDQRHRREEIKSPGKAKETQKIYTEGDAGLTIDCLLRFVIEEFNRFKQNDFDQLAASLKLAEFAEDGLLPFEDFYEACRRAEPTAKRNRRWIEKSYYHYVSICKPDMHNETDIVNSIIPLLFDEQTSRRWYLTGKQWENTYQSDQKQGQKKQQKRQAQPVPKKKAEKKEGASFVVRDPYSQILFLEEMLKYVKNWINQITPGTTGDIFKTNQYLFKQIQELKDEEEQLFRIAREDDQHDPTDDNWALFRTMMTNTFKALKIIT